MAFQPSDLRKIPLFAQIPDAQLAQLAGIFERRDLDATEVLFEEGRVSDRLAILIDGIIAIRYGDERIRIRPVAPIGELGALARLRRATTAIAEVPATVLEITTGDLMGFFESHGDIGFRFHQNLMYILAEKIVRDRRRTDEIRHNLIATQKGMKRMREALLEAEDTPLHRMMFEEMDALVEQNRRGHYLADVAAALPTRVRLDGGSVRDVRRMSNERIHLSPGPGAVPLAGGDLSAVLVLPDGEVPITGTVEVHTDAEAVLALDPMIDEYGAAVDAHVVRLQLLDLVL